MAKAKFPTHTVRNGQKEGCEQLEVDTEIIV
jgi:hypothetical protein